jgi:transcriptional regulator with XRE-family HTH domain
MKCPRCKGSGEVPEEQICFGDLLRSRREDLRMTQEELASKVGLSRSQIANLEVGRRDTSVKMLAVFAQALECRAKDLIS